MPYEQSAVFRRVFFFFEEEEDEDEEDVEEDEEDDSRGAYDHLLSSEVIAFPASAFFW